MGQRGAFILGQVHNKQLSTYTQLTSGVGTIGNTGTLYTSINTWDLGNSGTYGWWGSGTAAPVPTTVSTVDRIDFANDSPTSSSVRGPLTSVRYAIAAAGNANYGWFSGGYTPSAPTSDVQRIDYANDSPVSSSLRGNLLINNTRHGAVSNANYVWWGGGRTPAGKSSVYRLDVANDSPTSPTQRGPLSAGGYNLGSTGNANYGWVVGLNPSYDGTASSFVCRIDYSNDSPATGSTRSPLASTRYKRFAVSNANYGWFGGTVNISANTTTVERIDFSNDSPTSGSIRGPLSAVSYHSGASNANYGWFGGGLGYLPGVAHVSTVDRLDFANDTATGSIRGPLSVAKRGGSQSSTSNYVKTTSPNLQYPTQALGSNQPVAGYGWYGGGSNAGSTGAVSYVDRIDFSNDSPTTTSARGFLSAVRVSMGATGNANYGWFGGGAGNPTTTKLSSVNRIDYSNDSPTSGSPRGFLSVARSNLSATGNANYGWWVGGFLPAPSVGTSYVDRIDFSNDSPTTASPRGPLGVATIYSTAATGNANYGWFMGGYTSQVHRIDFSNDSPATSSLRGLMPAVYGNRAATGNANYGWFAGGAQPGAVSTVNRIDFSNDSPTAASIRGLLSSARQQLSAAGNAYYGWFSGGVPPAGVSTVDRIDYSNDSPTSASPRGFLSSARYGHGGTSNYVKPSIGQIKLADPFVGGGGPTVGTYGWWGGGSANPVPSITSIIDRIDWANDSPATASVRGPMISARYHFAAAGNANYGWFAGGMAPSDTSNIQRITYANDSPGASETRGPLPVNNSRFTAVSNANYVWFAGGQNGALSSVHRLDASNDSPTSASIRGPLSAVGYNLGSTGNSNYGWFAGVGSGVRSTVNRIDYSNDSPTSASIRGPLVSARYKFAAVSNANYGWFAGVNTFTGTPSTIQRIDFANDLVTSVLRGNLTAGSYKSASGNANYGWFGGGLDGSSNIVSTVDRLDFANDSATGSVRGPLSVAKRGGSQSSTSNYLKNSPQVNIARYFKGSGTADNSSVYTSINVGIYGWFAGGNSLLSSISRIDFANDSPTVGTARGILSVSRVRPGSAGNANYGWFGGGYTSGNASLSTVDRLDYANDSPATSIRGQLTIARQAPGATGNANYGWFIGGFAPGAPTTKSSIDRIDYANDSPTSAGARGLLPLQASQGSATGNANYGWYAGGNSGGPVIFGMSIVQRIDFSNDSATAVYRGPLSSTRYALGATGNSNYGWFAGGTVPGPAQTSRVERIDYSNDSPTLAMIRGPLTATKVLGGVAGNANYGWFGGAQVPGGPLSNVDRIDYSNDSPTSASPRGFLNVARGEPGATSNYVR